MKRIFLILLMILCVLAVCLLSACGPEESLPEENTPEQGTEENASPEGLPTEITQEITDADGNAFGLVRVTIPKAIAEAFSAEAIEQASATLTEIYTAFCAQATGEMQALHEADPTWEGSRELTFSLYYEDEEIVSIIGDTYAYGEGDMHPSQSRYGYTFDQQDGSRLTLTELTGSTDISVLTAEIAATVEARGETDLYYPGLAENLYQCFSEDKWYADGDTVFLCYDAYSIASGAVGALEFPVTR